MPVPHRPQAPAAGPAAPWFGGEPGLRRWIERFVLVVILVLVLVVYVREDVVGPALLALALLAAAEAAIGHGVRRHGGPRSS